jgi:hypothetical protein
VLSAAVRYGAAPDVLHAELQQLGLPRESADGLARPFAIHAARLRAQAAADALALPRLTGVAVRTDAVLATAAAGALSPPATVLHVSLFLSHGLAGRRARAPAAGADATQLLALARAGAGAAAPLLDAATAAAGAAALAALGVAPLAPPQPAAASPAAAAAGAHAGAPAPALRATEAVHFSASAGKAAALLAELRVAREVMRKVAAATAPAPPA